MRRLGLALALLLVAPAAAQAHIQVTPTVVAPDDPVKFTVLVPGEKTAQTTRVALKMPAGLLPFSYEDPPGWKRTLVKASNGGVDQVVWTGRLAADGFVEFSFLAGTPEKPGSLTWKALQTYSDGSVVRWIGAPDSEQPAPVTQVVGGAPKQNAGGEGRRRPPRPRRWRRRPRPPRRSRWSIVIRRPRLGRAHPRAGGARRARARRPATAPEAARRQLTGSPSGPCSSTSARPQYSTKSGCVPSTSVNPYSRASGPVDSARPDLSRTAGSAASAATARPR